jgi:23S rRNA (uracil1939-C5)-methyltransferase
MHERFDNDAVLVPSHWAKNGEAIAVGKDGGPDMTVFGGIPGEKCAVRIIHEGQNMVFGLWRKGIPRHDERVTPSCEHYEQCGGCPLMHVTREEQFRALDSTLKNILLDEGISDVPIMPIVPSPAGPLGYRHVTKLTVSVSDRGSPRIGAPGRRRHIVPIPECGVITPLLREIMRTIFHLFVDMEIEPWFEGEGLLRHIVMRQSSWTNEVMVTLVAGGGPPILEEMAANISGKHPEVVGVHLHIHKEEGNAIFVADESGVIRTKHILGKKLIDEKVGGVIYQVGPGDFFQTNPSMANRLVDDVIKFAGLKKGVPFLDLYCGVGGFALAGAKIAGWALGVETVDGAVDRARSNASLNGIPAEFISGNVLMVLEDMQLRLRGKHPVIVVNPSRRGLEEGVIEAMIELNPSRIVYVSCNPESLGRDIRQLQKHGMVPREFHPYEMFPNTPHQEVVAILDHPDRPVVASRGPRRKVVR